MMSVFPVPTLEDANFKIGVTEFQQGSRTKGVLAKFEVCTATHDYELAITPRGRCVFFGKPVNRLLGNAICAAALDIVIMILREEVVQGEQAKASLKRLQHTAGTKTAKK
jgi:hypothetical protein